MTFKNVVFYIFIKMLLQNINLHQQSICIYNFVFIRHSQKNTNLNLNYALLGIGIV